MPDNQSRSLPIGTVTLLFTDLEKSTRLLEYGTPTMKRALVVHHDLLRRAIEDHGGTVFETVGDAVYAVFATASEALEAAIECQHALSVADWGQVGPLRARMALHSGELERRGDGEHYVGEPLIRCARLLVLGYGGQTLVSNATAELARPVMPRGARLKSLGEHRLKDLPLLEPVFQLEHPDLPDTFPPLMSIDARPNNLPTALTTFIGRSRELAELEAVVREARLVTLTGVGGTGKTRLALEVARRLLPDFTHGAFVVELAPIVDPQLVWPAIGNALGLHERPGEVAMSASSRIQTLVSDYVRGKRLLVVLDNCEHLIDACAAAAHVLVSIEPQLVIMATSREALGVAGERVWPVPSLAEAEDLFLERARAANAEFQIGEGEAQVLTRICDRLDRSPLALELAAARTMLLSLTDIDARLDDRFRLLTSSARDVAPRQQTLRAAVDWSYALLSAEQRTLWIRLSVFSAGFRVEAAEVVAARPPLVVNAVLDLLGALVARSLVSARSTPKGVRYAMLETLREYAHERLTEAGELDEFRREHARYFVELAEREAVNIDTGDRQRDALDRLDADLDNLRVAMRWTADRDIDLGVRLGLACRQFWYVRGHYEDAVAWRDTLLPRVTSFETDRAARALRLGGTISAWRNQYDRAASLLGRSLDAFRAIGDDAGTGETLRALGSLASRQGDLESAEQFCQQSLAIETAAGRPGPIASSRLGIGLAAWERGQYARAREEYEAALSVLRGLGDTIGSATVMQDLALIELDDGRIDRAEPLAKESVQIHRELGTSYLTPALNALASVVRVRGEHDRAMALYVEAERIERELHQVWPLVATLLGQAEIALARLDAHLAERLGLEVMRILAPLDSYRAVAWCYEIAARVAVLRGDWERAAVLFGARAGTLERTGLVDPPWARVAADVAIAETRRAVGQERHTVLSSEGAAMKREVATAFVLARTETAGAH